METELVREIPKEVEWDDGCSEIAAKADEVFGYSWGTKNLAAKQAENAFLQVLRELAVEPFTRESVEQYKARKLREENTPGWVEPVGAAGLIVALISIALIIAGLVEAGLVLCSWIGGPLFVVGLGMLAVSFSRDTGKQYQWVRNPLKDYDGPVPEFALQTALEIKGRCPEAQFWVNSLQDHADPFLVVSVHDIKVWNESASYYIEVWNEPEFKAKREV